MARKKQAIPSYLLHPSSGQARVRIDGHDYLLGPFGSDESRVRYGELVAKVASGQKIDPLKAAKRGTSSTNDEDQGPTVGEICLNFSDHADRHYVKNGKPTSEIICYQSCSRILRGLYGMTPAKDFGPLALKAVRAAMVAGDPDAKNSKGEPAPRKPWSRGNVNIMVGRIRRIFKHAVENEMVDVSVLNALQAVAPLLAGRTEAHDNPPRHAVDQEKIDTVRNLVKPLVRDLIDVQVLTGARSGELLMLTTGMIDRTGNVWKATLADHKTAHHGHRRMIPFGPQAQLILTKYLSADPDKPLFHITRCAYCRAITRACKTGGIDRWTPHWLRHTFCSRTREACGIEAVQAVAGHSNPEMTIHYSSKMDSLASKTAAAVG